LALIKCPECQKDISSLVKTCPHCGFPLVEEPPIITPTVPTPQEVEVTGVKIKAPKLKGYLVIIFSLVAVLVLAFVGYKLISDYKAKKDYQTAFNTYVDNLTVVQSKMLSSGAQAEDVINLTQQVWNNAIHSEADPATDKYVRPNGNYVDDFNTALNLLWIDPTNTSQVAEISTAQDSVKTLMKSLQNPPKGLETCYSTVTELFSAYLALTEMAVNPTGSYTSYSDDAHKNDTGFMDVYNRLESQIPEKITK
jgi:hypothetical protein